MRRRSRRNRHPFFSVKKRARSRRRKCAIGLSQSSRASRLNRGLYHVSPDLMPRRHRYEHTVSIDTEPPSMPSTGASRVLQAGSRHDVEQRQVVIGESRRGEHRVAAEASHVHDGSRMLWRSSSSARACFRINRPIKRLDRMTSPRVGITAG